MMSGRADSRGGRRVVVMVAVPGQVWSRPRQSVDRADRGPGPTSGTGLVRTSQSDLRDKKNKVSFNAHKFDILYSVNNKKMLYTGNAGAAIHVKDYCS